MDLACHARFCHISWDIETEQIQKGQKRAQLVVSLEFYPFRIDFRILDDAANSKFLVKSQYHNAVFKSWPWNIQLNISTILCEAWYTCLLLLIKFILCCSLHSFVENGVSGISELFQSLENLLIGQEPALHKKSLFGRFSVEKIRMTLLELCCVQQFW